MNPDPRRRERAIRILSAEVSAVRRTGTGPPGFPRTGGDPVDGPLIYQLLIFDGQEIIRPDQFRYLVAVKNPRVHQKLGNELGTKVAVLSFYRLVDHHPDQSQKIVPVFVLFLQKALDLFPDLKILLLTHGDLVY